MYKPLADEIRPDSLEDVVGQQHILGENGMLRRIIESGKIPNMIFYGPSGTGKTTVARIIAERTNRTLRKLNATTAGLSDIKDIIAELDTFLTPGGVLLYLDEIQYFNKKQQQSLLEFIEDGRITLIASTTENPYFCVFNAILSRSTVFEFKSIPPKEMEPAVERAIRIAGEKNGMTIETEEGVVPYIATSCGGDVRKALNTVEILSNRRAFRYGLCPDEISAGFRSGCCASLSGTASGDGGSDRLLPEDPVFRQRGYRSGLSSSGSHCQGMRGHGTSAGASGGKTGSGGSGDPSGHLSQIQFRGPCHRCRGRRCEAGKSGTHPKRTAERSCRRHRF